MPEIAAAQTAADMTYAKPHAFMPTGGSNRRAARMQAAALRWLVRIAALLTAAVLVFLIGYILVMGIPNLKPELFAWEYNSENVSLTPALINTVLMTAFSLAISTPLGIFAAIWLVEYAHRGSKLVKVVRVTTETLQGIPSIVYGLFGMLFFVTKLHWGYSMIAGAFTLAIMVLPVIMRTTEEALIAVPDSYREGSFGLGAGKLRTVFTIVLPSAMPGILSGVILATGRIVGETAALIYTASSVAKIPSGVFSSTRTLAVHMYLLSNEGLYIGQTYGTAVSCWCWCWSSTACPALWPTSWQNGKGQCTGPYRYREQLSGSMTSIDPCTVGADSISARGSMRQRKPRRGVKTAWRRTTSAASQQSWPAHAVVCPAGANIVRSPVSLRSTVSHAYNPAPPYDSPFTGAM